MKVLSLMTLSALCCALGACSIFPYDSHFLCEKTADYGHCTTVNGAYDDAVSGTKKNADQADAENPHDHRAEQTEISKEGHSHSKDKDSSHSPAVDHDDARMDYQQSQYRALAGLVNQPVAPVLAPAKTLRTLIVAYEQNDSPGSSLPTLFMPRYVYYVVDTPHFVMSDRFAKSAPGVPMIYPNGSPRDPMSGH